MEGFIGFVIWALCGCLIIGIGVYAHIAKETVGFWANAERFAVTDVKKYNCAVGRLFIVYGVVFILLGIPLLDKGNMGLIMVSLVGTMVETIGIMVVYTTVIEKKYRKR